MKDMSRFMESIRHHYPELRLDTVERLNSGQNNDILLINSELIFRFPKYAQGIEQLERETTFLKAIVDHVSIEVPRPICWNFHPAENAPAFMGYKKIEGQPLEADRMDSIHDERIQRDLAGQLGNFLKELHSIPSREIPMRDADDNMYLEWSDLYERISFKALSSYEARSPRLDRPAFFKLPGGKGAFRNMPDTDSWRFRYLEHIV